MCKTVPYKRTIITTHTKKKEKKRKEKKVMFNRQNNQNAFSSKIYWIRTSHVFNTMRLTFHKRLYIQFPWRFGKKRTILQYADSEISHSLWNEITVIEFAHIRFFEIIYYLWSASKCSRQLNLMRNGER